MSMSRKGECLDNAAAESFFGSLKNELVHHKDYYIREEDKQSAFSTLRFFTIEHNAMNFWIPLRRQNTRLGIPLNFDVRFNIATSDKPLCLMCF